MKGPSGKIWYLALALSIALAPVSLAGSKRSAKAAARNPSGQALEVEPSPPLSLDVRLINLQKNSKGGVASVALDALSDLELSEVTVTVTLPPDVTFSDGSRVFTQTLNLSAGSTFTIPKDLLVDKDGKHIVTLEATGTTPQGKAVRRGMAYKLLVGAQEKLPEAKDGAIEYEGVPGGGA